jgi:hypothetical protein
MVDATWRVQNNSGLVTTAASSFNATLPNPTQPGSTLILFLAMNTFQPNLPAVDPPWYLEVQHAANDAVLRRDNQPAGETSWTITAASTQKWAWYIEEWSGLSSVNPDAQTTSTITTPPTPAVYINPGGQQTIDSSSVAQNLTCVPDITDYLAAAIFRVSSGTGAFPAARSYTTGFSEAAALSVGTGSTAGDFQLIIAEGFPGTSGSNVDCQMTFDITGGGTYADKSVDGRIACYGPATPNPDTGILTS